MRERFGRKTPSVLLIIGIGIGLISIAGWVNGDPSEATTHLSGIRLAPEFGPCNADCPDEECHGHVGVGHQFVPQAGDVEWTTDYEDPDTHSECTWVPADCEAHGHEECGGGEEEDDIDAVVLALETFHGPDLQRLLEQNPKRLFWNPERTSVQLWGCGQKVILSVQIDDAQAEYLND